MTSLRKNRRYLKVLSSESPVLSIKNLTSRFGTPLGFTKETSWFNSWGTPVADFEESLLSLQGLAGIVTYHDYQTWKSEYHDADKYVDYLIWMCPDNFSGVRTEAIATEYDKRQITPRNIAITGCSSRPAPVGDICKLEHGRIILLTILGCDVARIIIVVLTLQTKGSLLITTGDAIGSFLRRPEPSNKRQVSHRPRSSVARV